MRLEEVKKFSPDLVGVSNREEYEPLIKALAKYQQFAEVKNVSAAVHAMIKLTLQSLACYSEETQWVQLSSIFGGSALPKENAELIGSAIKKMIDSGLIDEKHKTDFLSVLAERYLAGESFG